MNKAKATPNPNVVTKNDHQKSQPDLELIEQKKLIERAFPDVFQIRHTPKHSCVCVCPPK